MVNIKDYVELGILVLIILLRYFDRISDRHNHRTTQDIFKKQADNDTKIVELIDKITEKG